MDAATLAIGSLLPKLYELLKEEYELYKAVRDDISDTIDALEMMHSALRERVEVPPDQLDERVNLWALEVRAHSYRIEDSVDGILNLQTKAKLRHNISLMTGEMKALQEVLLRLPRYEFDPASYTVDPRLVGLYTLEEEDLVGVDEARDELIKMLTEGDDMSKQKRKIVSIVGFAGLGKTTLANMVYRKLREQFECTAFVSVSPRPNMKRILSDMLRQLEKYTDSPDEEKDEEQPINEIRELLWNKRYLIVIDDLWNAEDWDSILRSLPSNDYGSRVITTTRVNDIAKKCCSSHDELIYKMEHLGHQNSKILFLKRFRGRSEFSYPDAPTEVLDEILKVCGGMPGAIISIASLLDRKVAMEESWQEMMRSLHPARGAIRGLEDLRKILSLSYFDLPSTLRTCLLYLATSAKNQSINRDSLVRKWIAEGFISEDGGHSREEVANRYFDELINSNVIQPVQHGNCPGEETYEVHYMMLHALWVMAKEQRFVTFLSDFGISDPSGRPAYLLSIQCFDSGRSIDAARMDLSHVRSVTTFGPAKLISFKKLEYMRVLDLDGCKDLDNTDVDDICRMILLKYLSLKQTQLTALPPKIGKLQNLETLDVSQTRLIVLPPEIGELQNMKTLDVSQTLLIELPQEIGKLLNLKTLDVRQTQVTKLPLKIGELQNLKTLDVRQTQVTELPPEIGKLQNLETLDVRQTRVEVLPPEIGKILNLKTLDVRQTQVTELPPEIGELQNLKTLDVRQTQVIELPPEIGKLQNLKTLDVSQMRVTELPPEIGNLQNLETLNVRQTQVEVLPPEIGKLQNLETLDVRQTQVIVLPPEIGKLQNLKTLDVSQTQVTELPPEIGKLQNLETLNVRQTRVEVLPPEIGKLQNLKTLDVGQTRVELPIEVVQLPKLTHLHFGQISSIIGGEKLSSGSKHLKSVDSRECSASVMAEISGLTEVREFSVVLYDGPADKQKNDNLLSSIGKLGNLESLTIYGDCNPSDELEECRNFQKLRMLKVAGRFVKVPGWIPQLSALHFLYIRVCKLEPNGLRILGRLRCLRSLVLILVGLPRKQVAITSDAGFVGLEVFNFDCRMPWVTFEQRAMPSLENLELKLYAGSKGKIPSGIVCLKSLNKVILSYSSQYESSDRVTETVDVMKEEAVSHANSIVLSINGVEEIFPSNTIVNRRSRRITGTEIEE